MPGRKYAATGSYRYGFNGKEKSDEVYGDGNIYDYGFRIYDPRLGRFLSVDPLTREYPWYTPYQFAGNKPIFAVDLDGLEERPSIYDKYKEVLTGGPKVKKYNSLTIPQTSTAQSGGTILTDKTRQKGYAQKMLAQKYGRNDLERSHYAVYKANREREDQEGLHEFVKMTDVNDAVILATSITRKQPIQSDGTEADGVDQGFAMAGIFIPFVSGSLVNKVASPLIKGSIKVFKSGLEQLEDAVKIGKYGFRGTKQWNEVVRAVQSGGNIVANSKEEALKFLKESFPDMVDETGKATSKYGYRIDEFVEETKDGLKQGHQGWHINYYDKENKIKGTILVDAP